MSRWIYLVVFSDGSTEKVPAARGFKDAMRKAIASVDAKRRSSGTPAPAGVVRVIRHAPTPTGEFMYVERRVKGVRP
jgi:hypothetical protein